jgi:hypothetical protein
MIFFSPNGDNRKLTSKCFGFMLRIWLVVFSDEGEQTITIEKGEKSLVSVLCSVSINCHCDIRFGGCHCHDVVIDDA